MIAYPKWHAFTLVEILVIIVLTGIMATILYPIIGNAREKTRQIRLHYESKAIGDGDDAIRTGS